jgi:hypothetical protein
MASPYTQTAQDISAAVNLRLLELGHNLSPSHQTAILYDIIAVLQTDNATIVADAATDSVKYKPPPHTKF